MFAKPLKWLAAAALFVIAATTSLEAYAVPAGAVEFVRGAGSLQRPGKSTQLLGRGQQIEQGDIITTGANSSAIILLTDGTRMTMRADSKFVLQIYDFKANAPAEDSAGSMVIGLLKGGMRTLTGLIPKRDTNAARVITQSATVGIRGTDFDVRLCVRDCPRNLAQAVPGSTTAARALALVASARIVELQGSLTATDAAGTRRLMANGGPVYPGDVLESAAGAYAVLVFRDDSRATIQPASRLKIDDFVFDKQNPREGRMLLSLLKGGLRAFTGLIGKANHANVSYRTPTATVGIRGSGGDMQAGDDNTALSVWEGQMTLTATSASCTACTIEISAGGNAIANLQGVLPSNIVLPFDTPRPDQVTPPANLFSAAPPPADNEGLYVFVRDGHVSITTATEVLNLGKNEAAFSGAELLRLDSLPSPLISAFNTGVVNELARRTNAFSCVR